MRALVGPAGVALAAGLLSACVSSGEVKMTGVALPMAAQSSPAVEPAAGSQVAAMAPVLPARPSVMVVVQPVAKDSERVRDELLKEVVGQLRATGEYLLVAGNDVAADLIMTVAITDYRRVSGGVRFMVGAFAGKNRVVAQVSVSQRATGAVLRSFEVKGESSFTNFSSIGDAVRQVAKHIATVKLS